MNEIVKFIPNSILLIVGPDFENYKKELEKIIDAYGIRKNITFIGSLERKDVKKAYIDSDVFVLPSYSENFGLTIIESLACGCPVIISKNVNISTDIENNKLGIVIECESNDLSKSVINFHKKSHDEKAEHKKFIRKFTLENYDWNKSASKFKDLYRSITRS